MYFCVRACVHACCVSAYDCAREWNHVVSAWRENRIWPKSSPCKHGTTPHLTGQKEEDKNSRIVDTRFKRSYKNSVVWAVRKMSHKPLFSDLAFPFLSTTSAHVGFIRTFLNPLLFTIIIQYVKNCFVKFPFRKLHQFPELWFGYQVGSVYVDNNRLWQNSVNLSLLWWYFSYCYFVRAIFFFSNYIYIAEYRLTCNTGMLLAFKCFYSTDVTWDHRLWLQVENHWILQDYVSGPRNQNLPRHRTGHSDV